jgi:hypothetical protein
MRKPIEDHDEMPNEDANTMRCTLDEKLKDERKPSPNK